MSSQECTGALEVLIGPSRGLRVEFRNLGDRFEHEILLIHDEERISVLKSYEGCELEEHPQIPCFQEFHQQGQTLFLTGATGIGHWSMCVQVGEARFLEEEATELVGTLDQRYGLNAPVVQSDRRVAFQYLSFDVACRLRESTQQIGSEYHKAENFDSYLSGDLGTATDSGTPDLKLLVRNPRRHALLLDPQPACSIVHTDATNLRLFSQHDLPDELPATVQWCYGVQAM